MPVSSVLPPYCVYILKSLKDGDLYTGYTTDLLRRETYLKSTIGKRTLHLMLADSLTASPSPA